VVVFKNSIEKGLSPPATFENFKFFYVPAINLDLETPREKSGCNRIRDKTAWFVTVREILPIIGANVEIFLVIISIISYF